uniref:Uncharacterized protein n=1 Tax=Chromera velia CCMP2878 TaxID=1169474 RepID=A0A0G4G3N3_9ALVE|eukprot:Cvel_20083.t1-p1 / transcript=Cvel_20083.t1 / gene=Cvel_20083 / organism=Chromera_velia_CCMP2878 / gene_product=Fibrillin-1, putative / transcript_product=Fibrillin-1, putative / location=Cvel_scaffold1777:22062-37151(+) / protein_length=2653 / sequence_SO=supercontig / SO=protein_coding / is_pseudo=false
MPLTTRRALFGLLLHIAVQTGHSQSVPEDECGSGTDTCATYTSCLNTVGSFLCQCDPGFESFNDTHCIGRECTGTVPWSGWTSSELVMTPEFFIADGREVGGVDGVTEWRAADSVVFSCPDGFELRGAAGVSCEPPSEEMPRGSPRAVPSWGEVGERPSCENLNECELGVDTCGADATCVDSEGSFECSCESGYELDAENDCKNIDECDLGLHTCSVNATCIDSDGSFECSCERGYELDEENDCKNINECERGLDTCGVNATCNDSAGSFECSCESGYELDGANDCENVDECERSLDRCGSGATCVDSTGSFGCSCESGYELDGDHNCRGVNECELGQHSCGVGASCTDTPGSFVCSCEGDGFELDRENDCRNVNECETGVHSCGVGAACVDSEGSFACSCEEGFELGDQNDCKNIDECDLGLDTCGVNATCTDAEGSFSCSCERGYQLDEENDCKNIDECSLGLHPCHPTGECVDSQGSFECACPDGYIGDGFSECLEDPNECTSGAATCGPHTRCINGVGSFVCQCHPGFRELNETHCLGLECDGPTPWSGWGPVSDAGEDGEEELVMTPEFFIADGREIGVIDGMTEWRAADSVVFSCPDGFELRGAAGVSCEPPSEEMPRGSPRAVPSWGEVGERPSCENIDECERSLDTCGSGATCVDSNGSFQCSCERGYELDGDNNCRDVNECDLGLHTCGVNATCIDSDGSFECSCERGYELDEENDCNDVNECERDLDTCGVRARCADSPGSFLCSCETGYEMDEENNCNNIDECNLGLHTCGVNATCIDSDGSFECSCERGYELDEENDCKKIDWCERARLSANSSEVCEEGSECVNTLEGHVCVHRGCSLEGNGCPALATCEQTTPLAAPVCVCREGLLLMDGECRVEGQDAEAALAGASSLLTNLEDDDEFLGSSEGLAMLGAVAEGGETFAQAAQQSAEQAGALRELQNRAVSLGRRAVTTMTARRLDESEVGAVVKTLGLLGNLASVESESQDEKNEQRGAAASERVRQRAQTLRTAGDALKEASRGLKGESAASVTNTDAGNLGSTVLSLSGTLKSLGERAGTAPQGVRRRAPEAEGDESEEEEEEEDPEMMEREQEMGRTSRTLESSANEAALLLVESARAVRGSRDVSALSGGLGVRALSLDDFQRDGVTLVTPDTSVKFPPPPPSMMLSLRQVPSCPEEEPVVVSLVKWSVSPHGFAQSSKGSAEDATGVKIFRCGVLVPAEGFGQEVGEQRESDAAEAEEKQNGRIRIVMRFNRKEGEGGVQTQSLGGRQRRSRKSAIKRRLFEFFGRASRQVAQEPEVIQKNVTTFGETCQFWDHSLENVGAYSREGCVTGPSSNSTHTECFCTHLTSFSSVLDTTRVVLTDTNYDVIWRWEEAAEKFRFDNITLWVWIIVTLLFPLQLFRASRRDKKEGRHSVMSAAGEERFLGNGRILSRVVEGPYKCVPICFCFEVCKLRQIARHRRKTKLRHMSSSNLSRMTSGGSLDIDPDGGGEGDDKQQSGGWKRRRTVPIIPLTVKDAAKAKEREKKIKLAAQSELRHFQLLSLLQEAAVRALDSGVTGRPGQRVLVLQDGTFVAFNTRKSLSETASHCFHQCQAALSFIFSCAWCPSPPSCCGRRRSSSASPLDMAASGGWTAREVKSIASYLLRTGLFDKVLEARELQNAREERKAARTIGRHAQAYLKRRSRTSESIETASPHANGEKEAEAEAEDAPTQSPPQLSRGTGESHQGVFSRSGEGEEGGLKLEEVGGPSTSPKSRTDLFDESPSAISAGAPHILRVPIQTCRSWTRDDERRVEDAVNAFFDREDTSPIVALEPITRHPPPHKPEPPVMKGISMTMLSGDFPASSPGSSPMSAAPAAPRESKSSKVLMQVEVNVRLTLVQTLTGSARRQVSRVNSIAPGGSVSAVPVQHQNRSFSFARSASGQETAEMLENMTVSTLSLEGDEAELGGGEKGQDRWVRCLATFSGKGIRLEPADSCAEEEARLAGAVPAELRGFVLWDDRRGQKEQRGRRHSAPVSSSSSSSVALGDSNTHTRADRMEAFTAASGNQESGLSLQSKQGEGEAEHASCVRVLLGAKRMHRATVVHRPKWKTAKAALKSAVNAIRALQAMQGGDTSTLQASAVTQQQTRRALTASAAPSSPPTLENPQTAARNEEAEDLEAAGQQSPKADPQAAAREGEEVQKREGSGGGMKESRETVRVFFDIPNSRRLCVDFRAPGEVFVEDSSELSKIEEEVEAGEKGERKEEAPVDKTLRRVFGVVQRSVKHHRDPAKQLPDWEKRQQRIKSDRRKIDIVNWSVLRTMLAAFVSDHPAVRAVAGAEPDEGMTHFETAMICWAEVWGVLMLTALFYTADGDEAEPSYNPEELWYEVSILTSWNMRMIIAVVLAEVFSLPIPLLLDRLLHSRVPFIPSLAPLRRAIVRCQKIPIDLINRLYTSKKSPLFKPNERQGIVRSQIRRGRTEEEAQAQVDGTTESILPPAWRRKWRRGQTAKRVVGYSIAGVWIGACMVYLLSFALVWDITLEDVRDWAISSSCEGALEIFIRPLVVALLLTLITILAFQTHVTIAQNLVRTHPVLVAFAEGGAEDNVEAEKAYLASVAALVVAENSQKVTQENGGAAVGVKEEGEEEGAGGKKQGGEDVGGEIEGQAA